jgi:transposase
MAYRFGNRHQMILLPQSIEEYVAEDDPVRAYDAFVEALDFNALGIDINPHKVGNAQYDPKAMTKLSVILMESKAPANWNAKHTIIWPLYGLWVV